MEYGVDASLVGFEEDLKLPAVPMKPLYIGTSRDGECACCCSIDKKAGPMLVLPEVFDNRILI